MKFMNPHTMARWELAATVEPGKVVEVARIVRDRNHRLGEALDRDVKASQTTAVAVQMIEHIDNEDV